MPEASHSKGLLQEGDAVDLVKVAGKDARADDGQLGPLVMERPRGLQIAGRARLEQNDVHVRTGRPDGRRVGDFEPHPVDNGLVEASDLRIGLQNEDSGHRNNLGRKGGTQRRK